MKHRSSRVKHRRRNHFKIICCETFNKYSSCQGPPSVIAIFGDGIFPSGNPPIDDGSRQTLSINCCLFISDSQRAHSPTHPIRNEEENNDNESPRWRFMTHKIQVRRTKQSDDTLCLRQQSILQAIHKLHQSHNEP